MSTTENPFLYAPPTPKSKSGFLVTVLMFVSLIAGLGVFLYLFVIVPNQVDGQSMEPTFHDNEFVLTNRLVKKYNRGDVVVFKPPEDKTLIKRVIATEGDTVRLQGGRVYVNGQMLTEPYLAPGTLTVTEGFLVEGQDTTVPKGEYFLMGDNRPNSRDSRSPTVGFVESAHIQGRVIMIVLPFSRLQTVHNGQPTSQ